MSAWLLVMRLLTVRHGDVAEAQCSAVEAPDSGAWWLCVVDLETVRCEGQGWCGP